MERAFEAHLDMAARSIETINGMTFKLAEQNLQGSIANAFEMVAQSDKAVASATDVLSAFQKLAFEMSKTPLGIGGGEGVERAKELTLKRIEILRKDLQECPPSSVAKALYIE